MNYSKSIKLLTALLLFSFTIISCSDDPASVDEDPPEFPSFEHISPDLSYFEQDIPTESPAYFAATYANSFSYVSQLGSVYSSMFYEADRDAGNYEDGVWTWEYEYNWQGVSGSIVLKMEQFENESHWSMTWSYSGNGQEVENYTVVEGTLANDNSYGSWKFNDLDQETGEHYPIMETSWERISDTESEIITDIYEEGDSVANYRYEQDGVEHTITMNTQNEDNNIIIYWNEETGNGYYQEGSEQRCWDADFQETEC
ncbi:MAG: hypothetical protein WD022_11095 [Balneolaceae bacterium]